MKKINRNALLCAVCLLAFTLFVFTSCTAKDDFKGEPIYTQNTSLGKGENTFTVSVTDYDGKETVFEISTDKTIVGEALVETGLIEGENGPYGMYIKTVNGIRADYDLDGKYWAFYINGEYATSGVDTTEISPETQYALKVE